MGLVRGDGCGLGYESVALFVKPPSREVIYRRLERTGVPVRRQAPGHFGRHRHGHESATRGIDA